MSKAKPMSLDRRKEIYYRDRSVLTPAQRRRLIKKWHRSQDD